MVQINSRSQNSNCSVRAVIDNADGVRVNVRISWDYTTSAPEYVNVSGDYSSAQGGYTVNFSRRYSVGGTYTPAETAPEALDATFENALKSLITSCFTNYSNVELITVEE